MKKFPCFSSFFIIYWNFLYDDWKLRSIIFCHTYIRKEILAWSKVITPPNYSRFPTCFLYSAVLQTRSSSFVFPSGWPPTARGFLFLFSVSFSFWRKWRKGLEEKADLISFFFLDFFEMRKWGGGKWWRKNSFIFLLFWRKKNKGNWRKRRIGFHSFFLNFSKEEGMGGEKWWRENSSISSFPSFLLKEKRKKKMKKNRRVRLLSLGFLFEKEVGEERGEGRGMYS